MSASRAGLKSFPRHRDSVAVMRADGETLLIDEVNDTQHRVNPTAQALWELCDGSTSVEEMIEAILMLFAADSSVVREDVTRALCQLTDLGLLAWG